MNKIVILAAGQGKRMNSELPKVLVNIKGRPMLWHLVNSVVNSGVDSEPVIVVSPDNKDLIKDALRDFNCTFAIQEKQLGTGHAFKCALDVLPKETNYVFCLYGDHPFISEETIKKITTMKNSELSLLTITVPDFEDWRKGMLCWGRIVRNGDQVKEIVEYKDASEDIREIKELSPSLFRFDYDWVMPSINSLKNQNAQHEYYLTDLVKMASEENIKISSMGIKPEEAIGINTKDELDLAESFFCDQDK
jgi:bifunctional UDP-N-acetylglucosamine pyrophosphorylase/glucosamine-1-phosphate N-acetyltransferase